MTDREKLEQLLKEFGLEYNPEDEKQYIKENQICIYPWDLNEKKFEGYGRIEFNFDENGKFVKVISYDE